MSTLLQRFHHPETSEDEAIHAAMPQFYKHPRVWLKNKLWLLFLLITCAYIGTLIIAGLYYLLFETWKPLTNAWHTVVADSALRHNIRDVGEGLLGGLLAQQVIWNHFKRANTRHINRVDQWEIAHGIPNVKDVVQNKTRLNIRQYIADPVMVLLYAIPGFIVGSLIVGAFEVTSHLIHAAAHLALGTKVEHTVTASWPKKVIGLAAAFFWGRRPAKGVFDEIQGIFVHERVARGKLPRWWHPAPFRARYNVVAAEHAVHPLSAGENMTRRLVLSLVGFAMFCLAVFGEYVLVFIA